MPTDLKRVLVTCIPAAAVLFGVGVWKLATLPEPKPPVVHYEDPVGKARELYARAQSVHAADPVMAVALCDEAIATIDSLRASSPDPSAGTNYDFEDLYANVVRLKQICR